MHRAAVSGSVHVVKKLLMHGADIDAERNGGQTAHMDAMYWQAQCLTARANGRARAQRCAHVATILEEAGFHMQEAYDTKAGAKRRRGTPETGFR